MAEAAGLLLQWTWYAAALATIGAGGGYLTLARAARRDRAAGATVAAAAAGLRRIGVAGAAALVGLALIRVAVQAASAGSGIPSVGAMRAVVSGTAWGAGWWGQLYVALLATAGLLIAGRRPRQGWSLATAATLGIAYTLPMTGDGEHDRIRLALAALHVFGAGVLAGVPMLLLAVRGAPFPALRDANRWTLALGAGVALASGAVLAQLPPSGLVVVKTAAAAAAIGLARRAPAAALAAGGVALLLTALG